MTAFINRGRQMLLTMMFTMTLGGQDIIVRDNRAAGIIDRAIVIPNARFSRDEILRMSEDFLRANRGQTTLLRLMIGTDEFELGQSLGRATRGEDYQALVERLRTKKTPRSQLARLFYLDGAAIISYSDERGIADHLIGGDRDPTAIDVNGKRFRLLNMTLSVIQGTSTFSFLNLHLITEGRVSAGDCAEIAKLFKEKTRVPRLSVSVRKNIWFADDPTFPEVYRFMSPPPLPDYASYKTSPDVVCSIVNGVLSCAGHNFQP